MSFLCVFSFAIRRRAPKSGLTRFFCFRCFDLYTWLWPTGGAEEGRPTTLTHAQKETRKRIWYKEQKQKCWKSYYFTFTTTPGRQAANSMCGMMRFMCCECVNILSLAELTPPQLGGGAEGVRAMCVCVCVWRVAWFMESWGKNMLRWQKYETESTGAPWSKSRFEARCVIVTCKKRWRWKCRRW